MSTITIDQQQIGPTHPPYIIAEISANHNGSLEKAMELVRLAKECGADAVKLQTYTADTMTVPSTEDDFTIKGGLWDGYSLYDLYREAHTPWQWHVPLQQLAAAIGITLFSTPFDETAVAFLQQQQMPAYKVASFELMDLPLLKCIAATGKPMIVSTGMASFAEVEEALATITSINAQIILLHCVSGYPTPLEHANLNRLLELKQRFGVVTGISDHSLGTAVATAAVALGACVIEKHFTISRSEKGPDSEFSLEPAELRELCTQTRAIWQAMQAQPEGEGIDAVNKQFRRSIYFIKEMQPGEVITEDCIKRIRPGYGLAPKYAEQIIGKRVTAKIAANTRTSLDLIDMANP